MLRFITMRPVGLLWQRVSNFVAPKLNIRIPALYIPHSSRVYGLIDSVMYKHNIVCYNNKRSPH